MVGLRHIIAIVLTLPGLTAGTSIASSASPAECAKRFAGLFPGDSEALEKYSKTGLRGLTRAQVLEVESVIGARRVSSYADRESLRRDLQASFEIRCLRTAASCKDVLGWWKKRSQDYLENPIFTSIFADPTMTVERLSDLALSQYYLQQGKVKGSAWREKFAWMVSPQAMAAAAGTLAASVAVKVSGTLYNAATLGTMMKLWNAYTDAAVAPLEAHLKREGIRDLGELSKDIQDWLTRRSEAHQNVQEMKSEAEKFRSRVSSQGMTDEKAEKLWHDFQQYFYGKFMALNQGLPSNMREGRGFIYATEFGEPLAIVNFVSQRHDSYRASLARIRELEKRDASGVLDESARTELLEEREQLELKKRQIASGLAIFLIRKYMYRDDTYRPVMDSDRATMVALDSMQHDIIRGLGFQYFLREFLDQLLQVFQQYELVFKAADLDAYTAIEKKRR